MKICLPCLSVYKILPQPQHNLEHRDASSATSLYRSQIRLSHSQGKPRYSLFVAAGFFFTSSNFLHDVPYDPFLPFLFMGEELILSIRAFTNGYDVFSPSTDIVRHEYFRENSMKFWESVDYTYNLTEMQFHLAATAAQRIKRIIQFPVDDSLADAHGLQSFPEELKVKRITNYGLGTRRTLAQFLDISGIDFENKNVNSPTWCVQGIPHKYAITRN